MRFITYILIIQISTLSFFEGGMLGQFISIPQLFEHYSLHLKETPGLEISKFLFLHYVDSEHQSSDAKHDKLPFHHFQLPSAISHILFLNPLYIKMEVFEAIELKSFSELHFLLHFNSTYTRLLRPPGH